MTAEQHEAREAGVEVMNELSQRLIAADLRAAQLEHAMESLEREWRKDITKLNAITAERAADLAAIEQHAKVVGQLQQRIADALGYCKRHNHSGVNLAAHTYLNEVIRILEGANAEETETR